MFIHTIEEEAALSEAANALPEEIARYLSTVDLFRREGCVPVWRSERL
jgi:hypothetical protein